MLETDIEQGACDLIWKHLGIIGSKLKILGDTGYPDRVFWMPGGRPFFIEFKRPGEDPSTKQLKIHKQLLNLGYRVQTHDNKIDAFQAIIDAVDTTQLYENSRKILVRARRRCAILRSRARKDVN